MPQAQTTPNQEPQAGWTRLIDLKRLNPPPAGTFVSADGRELAVFALPDPHGIVVIDNACPHAHGNLSGGTLEGTVVECPWHQWRFDLSRGVCLHSDAIRVRKYATRVRDGALFVRLADRKKGSGVFVLEKQDRETDQDGERGQVD